MLSNVGFLTIGVLISSQIFLLFKPNIKYYVLINNSSVIVTWTLSYHSSYHAILSSFEFNWVDLESSLMVAASQSSTRSILQLVVCRVYLPTIPKVHYSEDPLFGSVLGLVFRVRITYVRIADRNRICIGHCK